MPEITRKTAWMKLAVLIADGLPEPTQVNFHSDGEILTLHFDAAAPVETWATALSLETSQPHRSPNTGNWHYGANGNWFGFRFWIDAWIDEAPEETTEDLTEVRALAAGAVVKVEPVMSGG